MFVVMGGRARSVSGGGRVLPVVVFPGGSGCGSNFSCGVCSCVLLFIVVGSGWLVGGGGGGWVVS